MPRPLAPAVVDLDTLHAHCRPAPAPYPELRQPCQLWRRSSGRGYGKVKRRGRYVRTHRLAYALAAGLNVDELPAGLIIRHRCDRGLCCEPSHLEAGDAVDNMADMAARGRAAGETGKLTEAEKLCIALDPRPAGDVARLYEVARTNVLQHRAVWLARAAAELGVDPAAIEANRHPEPGRGAAARTSVGMRSARSIPEAVRRSVATDPRPNTVLAAELGVSDRTVGNWRRRYAEEAAA